MKKFFTFCSNFSIAFNKKYNSDYSASAAFFLFLSFIPLLMFIFALLPYTGATEAEMLRVVLAISPDTMDSFIGGIVSEIYDNSAGIITVSIIITIWSAAKAIQSLMRGLNSINEIEENRNYFILRGLACLYTVIMTFAMLIMVVLLMFGRSIYEFIEYHFPQASRFKFVILFLRYPVGLILLIVLFCTIYCFVPSKKQKFKAQLPGAVFSSIIWLLASYIFGLYLDNFDGFSTYGSMATVIIVMFYMYMMMYIILVGAYLNHWLGRSVKS